MQNDIRQLFSCIRYSYCYGPNIHYTTTAGKSWSYWPIINSTIRTRCQHPATIILSAAFGLKKRTLLNYRIVSVNYKFFLRCYCMKCSTSEQKSILIVRKKILHNIKMFVFIFIYICTTPNRTLRYFIIVNIRRFELFTL